jgi:dTDP-4-amino-4,6-dideoxygalactose transaminase
LRSQYHALKAEIDDAISSTIDSSNFILGEKVSLFEKQFARWNNSSYCIGCANGTDAIEIALEALGVGAGDHVIVPAMTWISTAEAVVRVGAMPIFADVSPITYCLDIENVEKNLTSKTKAIIAVHLYGHPADVVGLRNLCDLNNLYLIEDCAQAHGAMVDQKTKVGNIGHIGTFSFFPGKNLGAYGDAGCIVTQDETLAQICRELGNHGQIKKHNHVRVGRNSRLDGIQAAILSAKLPFLDCWLERRRNLAKLYQTLLSSCSVQIPNISDPENHAFHLYVVLCETRKSLLDFLSNNGIETSVHYPKALNRLSIFQNYKDINNNSDHKSVAETLAAQAISLPIGDQLTIDQVKYVCDCMQRYFKD